MLLSLAAPALARAETIPDTLGAHDALLAVAPDGTPHVAYVTAADTVAVATRAADGTWNAQPVAVPAGTLLGFDGTALLVEASDGSQLWLALAGADGAWQAQRIATAPRGGVLGLGGLATTATGGHVVAYASLRPPDRSSLVLVRQSGTRVTTKTLVAGFPRTLDPPGAAPVVLPSGRVDVVETADGETIQWYFGPQGWTGQFLYANALGTNGGVTAAVAPPRAGVWTAWTELFSSYGESHVIVALHREQTYTAILSHHAFVVTLTPQLEVAADDYVSLPGNRLAYAGEVLGIAGPPLELAGDLYGYAPDGAGRQYLLLDAGGLEWFRTAAPPPERVTIAAAPDPAGIRLSGRVTGAAPGGSVELWKETPSGPILADTLPLAPDGSYTVVDAPTGTPVVYRAIYRDPASGLPIAALDREVLGG